MVKLSRIKNIYGISSEFDRYLREFSRGCRLKIQYNDLLRFNDAIAHYDKNGEDTLWSTVSYGPGERDEIHAGILEIYAFLRAEGDLTSMQHLVVDRVDLCLYGNTKPFRVRITNSLNDNFDYFYIKEADASRVFGLELEHILSPNRIGFFYFDETLVEEHIYGIPGDMFVNHYMEDRHLNKVRLAKEFVKFNERCFLRLLGDMHSANFVVDVTIDFEENFYRLRAIDFDQQCYEGDRKVYLPQFFKPNNPFVLLAAEQLSQESIKQYQLEERALIHKRIESSRFRLEKLFRAMDDEDIAPAENVERLRRELDEYYQVSHFKNCKTMCQIVKTSLDCLQSAFL